MKINVMNFIQKRCGIKLNKNQKETVKLLSALPSGTRIVMGRKYPMIFNKNNKRIYVNVDGE